MSGPEWQASEDLRDLAAVALGGDIVDVGASLDAENWRGRVLWCPADGVLKERNAVFRQALFFVGFRGWAQELLGWRAVGSVVRGGSGGAARWLAARVAPGPAMLWGFDVDHEALAEDAEPFGAVFRVGG